MVRQGGSGRPGWSLVALFSGAILSAEPGWAQSPSFSIMTSDVGKRANAVLGLMSFSVVPDVTTSTLSINAGTGSQSDTSLYMTQLAGGFTLSKTTPVYLEGGVAYSRYDPTFLASNGTQTSEVPLKWNVGSLSGGVGWDFPLTPKLVLRPIFNFALGSVVSDITVGSWYLEQKTGNDWDFLQGNTTMEAWGAGASLMLDYEDYKPEREIDVEWRYSNLYLRSVGEIGNGINAQARAESTSLWARWRAPMGGWRMMGNPVRYVLEGAHSTFLGSQAGLLGFNHLSSLGLGVEFDSSAYDVIVTRTRLVLRYRFGQNVEGLALGIAVSF